MLKSIINKNIYTYTNDKKTNVIFNEIFYKVKFNEIFFNEILSKMKYFSSAYQKSCERKKYHFSVKIIKWDK